MLPPTNGSPYSSMAPPASQPYGKPWLSMSSLFSSPGRRASPDLLIKTHSYRSHSYLFQNGWVFLKSHLLHGYTLFSLPFLFHKHSLIIHQALEHIGPGYAIISQSPDLKEIPLCSQDEDTNETVLYILLVNKI